MSNRAWTVTELRQVLQLYCTTPFGRIHRRNPEIQTLATAIGRTPSAVTLKMTNFASLDPTLKQSGMSNISKLDRDVWNEFFDEMMASLQVDTNKDVHDSFHEAVSEYSIESFGERAGIDVARTIKTRLNQSFFRLLILASYDNKCALTGIDAPGLLVASHIVPWSVEASVRMAPQNGICLNALHDRAFDQGLLTFDDDFSVILSGKIPEFACRILRSFGANKLRLPSRFIPDKKLLAFHRQNIFRGN